MLEIEIEINFFEKIMKVLQSELLTANVTPGKVEKVDRN